MARTFQLHWGSGIIAEEARFNGPHHEPCIQLLEFNEGDASGTLSVRFCYYDHAGRFQRSPLILDEDGMTSMRTALKAAPRLRELLRRLVEP